MKGQHVSAVIVAAVRRAHNSGLRVSFLALPHLLRPSSLSHSEIKEPMTAARAYSLNDAGRDVSARADRCQDAPRSVNGPGVPLTDIPESDTQADRRDRRTPPEIAVALRRRESAVTATSAVQEVPSLGLNAVRSSSRSDRLQQSRSAPADACIAIKETQLCISSRYATGALLSCSQVEGTRSPRTTRGWPVVRVGERG